MAFDALCAGFELSKTACTDHVNRGPLIGELWCPDRRKLISNPRFAANSLLSRTQTLNS